VVSACRDCRIGRTVSWARSYEDVEGEKWEEISAVTLERREGEERAEKRYQNDKGGVMEFPL
jgi:hypothetical protein